MAIRGSLAAVLVLLLPRVHAVRMDQVDFVDDALLGNMTMSDAECDELKSKCKAPWEHYEDVELKANTEAACIYRAVIKGGDQPRVYAFSGKDVMIKIGKRPEMLAEFKTACQKAALPHEKACEQGGNAQRLVEKYFPTCLASGGTEEAPFMVSHFAGIPGKRKVSLTPENIQKLDSDETKQKVFAELVGAVTALHGIGLAHNNLQYENIKLLETGDVIILGLDDVTPLREATFDGSYRQDETLIPRMAALLAGCPPRASFSAFSEDLSKEARVARNKAFMACIVKRKLIPHSQGLEQTMARVIKEAQAHKENPTGVETTPVTELYENAFIEETQPPLKSLFPFKERAECGGAAYSLPACDLSQYNPSLWKRYNKVMLVNKNNKYCQYKATDSKYYDAVSVTIKTGRGIEAQTSFNKMCFRTQKPHKAACHKAGGLDTDEARMPLYRVEKYFPTCVETGGGSDVPYIVYHRISGNPFTEKDIKGMDVKEKKAVFAQLVGALSALHASGLTHSDPTDKIVLLGDGDIVFANLDFEPFLGPNPKYKDDATWIAHEAARLAACPESDLETGKALKSCVVKAWGPGKEFLKDLGNLIQEIKNGGKKALTALSETDFITDNEPTLYQNYPLTDWKACDNGLTVEVKTITTTTTSSSQWLSNRQKEEQKAIEDGLKPDQTEQKNKKKKSSSTTRTTSIEKTSRDVEQHDQKAAAGASTSSTTSTSSTSTISSTTSSSTTATTSSTAADMTSTSTTLTTSTTTTSGAGRAASRGLAGAWLLLLAARRLAGAA